MSTGCRVAVALVEPKDFGRGVFEKWSQSCITTQYTNTVQVINKDQERHVSDQGPDNLRVMVKRLDFVAEDQITYQPSNQKDRDTRRDL